MVIQRVVTCFLWTGQKMALFHRCPTMPTFANHWAAVSGTIELNENPWEAARRELKEETNIMELSPTLPGPHDGGLYLDVPYISRKQEARIIRVYPFCVPVTSPQLLQLRGTEHDRYQWTTLETLEAWTRDESQWVVPGLLQAFHHATCGQYDASIPPILRKWASDTQNGASVLTRNALQLLEQDFTWAAPMKMLRPSMVSIVNVLDELLKGGNVTAASWQADVDQAVALGANALVQLYRQHTSTRDDPFTIVTFSRSGTLLQLFVSFLKEVVGSSLEKNILILCGESTPGNEGIQMAQDLQATSHDGSRVTIVCLADDELERRLGSAQVLLVGADCITPTEFTNKVGTKGLCETAIQSSVNVWVCADRWKVWDDIFPPPMEQELFERIPINLVSQWLVPGMDKNTGTVERSS